MCSRARRPARHRRDCRGGPRRAPSRLSAIGTDLVSHPVACREDRSSTPPAGIAFAAGRRRRSSLGVVIVVCLPRKRLQALLKNSAAKRGRAAAGRGSTRHADSCVSSSRPAISVSPLEKRFLEHHAGGCTVIETTCGRIYAADMRRTATSVLVPPCSCRFSTARHWK